MAVGPRRSEMTPARAMLKLAWWAVMGAAVFWTSLFMAADRAGSLPGFTYVNF